MRSAGRGRRQQVERGAVGAVERGRGRAAGGVQVAHHRGLGPVTRGVVAAARQPLLHVFGSRADLRHEPQREQQGGGEPPPHQPASRRSKRRDRPVQDYRCRNQQGWEQRRQVPGPKSTAPPTELQLAADVGRGDQQIQRIRRREGEGNGRGVICRPEPGAAPRERVPGAGCRYQQHRNPQPEHGRAGIFPGPGVGESQGQPVQQPEPGAADEPADDFAGGGVETWQRQESAGTGRCQWRAAREEVARQPCAERRRGGAAPERGVRQPAAHCGGSRQQQEQRAAADQRHAGVVSQAGGAGRRRRQEERRSPAGAQKSVQRGQRDDGEQDEGDFGPRVHRNVGQRGRQDAGAAGPDDQQPGPGAALHPPGDRVHGQTEGGGIDVARGGDRVHPEQAGARQGQREDRRRSIRGAEKGDQPVAVQQVARGRHVQRRIERQPRPVGRLPQQHQQRAGRAERRQQQRQSVQPGGAAHHAAACQGAPGGARGGRGAAREAGLQDRREQGAQRQRVGHEQVAAAAIDQIVGHQQLHRGERHERRDPPRGAQQSRAAAARQQRRGAGRRGAGEERGPGQDSAGRHASQPGLPVGIERQDRRQRAVRLLGNGGNGRGPGGQTDDRLADGPLQDVEQFAG